MVFDDGASVKLQCEPTSPEQILNEDLLRPLAMPQAELASHIGCGVEVVSRIVNGRNSVTAEMVMPLGAAVSMSPFPSRVEFLDSGTKRQYLQLFQREGRFGRSRPPSGRKTTS